MILTLTCLLGCNIIEHVLKIKPKCNLSEMRKGEDEGVEGKQKREDVHHVLKMLRLYSYFFNVVAAAYLFVIYIKMFRPNSYLYVVTSNNLKKQVQVFIVILNYNIELYIRYPLVMLKW